MRRHPTRQPPALVLGSALALAFLGSGLALAFLAAAPAVAVAQSSPVFEVPEWRGEWYRGNTHTHTTESDGDSSPEYVARWYRDHGYDFLVLSDHNVFTDPSTLADLVDEAFLLIPGEEVTSGFEGRPVHVNGLDIGGLVEPRRAETLVGTIQANVDAVREVEGVPHINHPNFGWAFGAEELAQVRDDRLLEIFNGHPHVHNHGGGGTPGLEEVWDALLTGGKRIYGIAVDDAHHFQGEFAGVALRDIVVTNHRIEVHIEPEGNFRYTTEFIGEDGRVLKTTGGNPAVFELDGPTSYVRARVTSSRGETAWVQPVFVISALGLWEESGVGQSGCFSWRGRAGKFLADDVNPES